MWKHIAVLITGRAWINDSCWIQTKDSAVKAVRRCFAVATANIAEERKTLAKKLAIAAASEAGETPPYEYENYKKFYTPPPPTLIAPTTPQGLIQHLNDIADLPLGAGAIYAG